MKRKIWNQQEITFLIQNHKDLSCLEISLNLNRTHKSVESKIFKLLSTNTINRKNKPVQVGCKYGRLTIIEKSQKKGRHGQSYYICKCDCGDITETSGGSMNSGSTKSCGCYNKERVQESHRLGIGESTYNRIEKTYQRNAKNRKIPYILSKEQFRFLISQNCHWCGEEPKPKNHYYSDGDRNRIGIEVTEEWAKKQWVLVNGIDRVDSSLGYRIENCVPCCFLCNEMKMDKSEIEFLEHMEKIYNFQKEKNKC